MIEAFYDVSPAWPVIIAGLLAAAFPLYQVRKGLALLAPILALGLWFNAPSGDHLGGIIELGGFRLETFRFDGLSRIWGLIFIIAAFINGLYGLHEKDRVADASGLIYAGAGLGAVFAGDLLSLFFFWELTAISSVFLIWGARNQAAYKAGLRYLAIHVLSGVLLLTGAVIRASETGSWAFDETLSIETLGGFLIFIAFGIKCAFPFLHNWLQDAYPKATITGAVVLSAFTTKLAVYALARGYAGTEQLIWIGAIMTAFPVFFAVVENDLRKVLSYSLNNQLGFMVVGIGVGTELAINGAAAHAFVHIIYKALLFMSMGAVLMRVGTVKASELGGLFKSMPATTVFCLIGAASISAFPLFSGFVAKALTLAAVAQDGHWLVWLVLVFASAGVLEHSGIKIPYFAFFSHDRGHRVREAPANMLMAMGIAALICVYLGVNYGVLYELVPFPEAALHYEPYTFDHIVGQMQLLLGAMFAFAFLVRMKWYPDEKRGVNIDTDWFYRRFLADTVNWGHAMFGRLWASLGNLVTGFRTRTGGKLFEVFSPIGALSRDIPSGLLAIWTSALLAIVLLIAYLAP
ncbi:cation:proton antiporter [Maricaulis sp. W15]|uniref:Multisubunit sodium/proton antiporter MrpD subunit n=1 Tax=Maricaulis maris TaxID=74318 RepID=A0A495D117_9PROT|nr:MULTISPECIES: Na(+)/H(+) antiporter subunit D [Maricaulis]OLF72316.1 cation:proton antiporter [Maricaulis sp. W15]RKQ95212.1 multisubunit sodium/proton antiporter MrpD subunit [Maricaulis maris]